MAHQPLEQTRDLTPLLQCKIAAAKAEALIEAAADNPTVALQLNRRAMTYARRAGDLQRAHHEVVTGVPAVPYAEDAVDSDVAPFRGCVSGSNREVAPFGLDWTQPGWSPATGRGASRGATPNPFPPPDSSPLTLGEPGTRSVSR